MIHLIDMDGAFIQSDAIMKDAEAEKTFYTTEIHTANPEHLIDRNKRKSDNVNRLCSMTKVWNSIPYQAYYMSANLDHVLHNKLNSTDADKEQDAYSFAKKYKDHLQEFLTFISESNFSVCGDFQRPWEYIKKEKHSLERHTNLGICFQGIRERRECLTL